MENDIAKAISLFRTLPELDDYAIYDRLVISGVDRQCAARLVEFLPIVYCRLILRNSGARFADTFQRSLPGGTLHEKLFSSEPIWNEVTVFAQKEIEGGVSKQDLLAVAARSSEFAAANQLLNRGARLEDIRFQSPVLVWPPGPSRPADTPK
jgi:hypothetical protein